ADGGAVDRGDDGQRAVHEAAHHLLQDGVLAAPDLVGHALALLEVGPGAEAGACPGEDQAGGGVGVDVEVGEAGTQLLHHARAHGVARRRPAQRDEADAVLADGDVEGVVWHASPAFWPVSWPVSEPSPPAGAPDKIGGLRNRAQGNAARWG